MKVKSSFLSRTFILMAVFCQLATAAILAETPQEKGLRIMQHIDQLPALEKTISESILHIYNAQGKKIFSKKSRSASYTANFHDRDAQLSRSISYFFSPADDKGNGALMIEMAAGDDNQWVYLKGLRKPKRILGSDKSSSFMGSDFSNGDVSARDIDDSDYVWLGTETLTFKKKKIKVEKIQSVFKRQEDRENYGYSKTIIWTHPKTGLPFQVEYYNLSGQLAKRAYLRAFAIKKNKNGKKVFMVASLEIQNLLKGTKTIMQMKNIKVGKSARKVTPKIFKVEYLTRKWW